MTVAVQAWKTITISYIDYYYYYYFTMAVDDEHRTLLSKCYLAIVGVPKVSLIAFLDKQLLAAARQDGNVEELLTSAEYRDPEDEDSFIFDINCTDL